MKSSINTLIKIIALFLLSFSVLIGAVSCTYQHYLEVREPYAPTLEQSKAIASLMQELCQHDAELCVEGERVDVMGVNDFALASLPVVGELFLTGEARLGHEKDTILLPEGLFQLPSLLAVTLSHEILHVNYSDESLIPNTSAFCDDHNRIKQMSVDTLVALKQRGFTYLLDRHIHSGGNQRKQCQSV